MPLRLRLLLVALCAVISFGSVFALYVGIQEIRLATAGPRRELLAEELTPDTRGHVVVLGCARHDLEVAISGAGIVVAGERDRGDRAYFALTSQRQCDEDTPPATLKVLALVEAADGSRQGLARLYEAGYKPPPTKVIIDGVIGYGAGDGYRYRRALRELVRLGAAPAIDSVPLLVKDRKPASKPAAYGTAIVGLHGLLLMAFLGALWLRNHLRGGVPPLPAASADLGDEAGDERWPDTDAPSSASPRPSS